MKISLPEPTGFQAQRPASTFLTCLYVTGWRWSGKHAFITFTHILYVFTCAETQTIENISHILTVVNPVYIFRSASKWYWSFLLVSLIEHCADAGDCSSFRRLWNGSNNSPDSRCNHRQLSSDAFCLFVVLHTHAKYTSMGFPLYMPSRLFMFASASIHYYQWRCNRRRQRMSCWVSVMSGR